MGVLTSAISRLSGEVVALRQHRAALRRELREGRLARRTAVRSMCGGFADARLKMARQSRQERAARLDNRRRVVGGKRQQTRADLAGARRAWKGGKG